eukprot:958494-Rhodomonas_salina.1
MGVWISFSNNNSTTTSTRVVSILSIATDEGDFWFPNSLIFVKSLQIDPSTQVPGYPGTRGTRVGSYSADEKIGKRTKDHRPAATT